MKIVLKLKEDTQKDTKDVIEYFVSYGYDEFIVFTENKDNLISRELKLYYENNQISVLCLLRESTNTTRDLLQKINSSLDKFILVYSKNVCNMDLDNLLYTYHIELPIATLGIYSGKMVVAIFDKELFDYFDDARSLEKDVLERIGEDMELAIYEENK
ncbi:MAG: hypothetical protein IJ004_04550 [Clostridia bacterium]|nr:hypothetical protein [Clostridia bacterium]